MPHRALAHPDDRGIRVGFISRRVLHDALEIRMFPDGLLPIQVGDDPPGADGPRTMSKMGRPALQVTVRANNHDVHIVSAHMKSKLPTRVRGNNAALPHLDGVLAGAGRDIAVILAGVMNDEVEAATTSILSGAPNPNERQGKPGADHAAVVATFDFQLPTNAKSSPRNAASGRCWLQRITSPVISPLATNLRKYRAVLSSHWLLWSAVSSWPPHLP